MDGAIVVLAVNITVALFFAIGYAFVAIVNPSQRSALWFSLSYGIGMLAPVSDFLAPFFGPAAAQPFEWLSYSTFLIALLSMSVSFSAFHKAPVPWLPILAVLIAGLVVRVAIGPGPRDTIAYGMAYQLPFVMASLVAVGVVLSIGVRRPLYKAVAAVFGLIAVHFLAKPFLSIQFGAGRTLATYTDTKYALFSQASTGVLLLAAGILLLLLVAQRAIQESNNASETDPLSGLANRRGFDRQAQAALGRARQSGAPISVAMFDLDHFKAINDTHGHGVGDQVIVRFATLLKQSSPSAAVVARTGGEEFAMLVENANGQSAWLIAEALRVSAAALPQDGLPAITISGGVAQWQAHESLSQLMRRADFASYEAKDGGRNRVILAGDLPGRNDPNIIALSTWSTRRRPQSDG